MMIYPREKPFYTVQEVEAEIKSIDDSDFWQFDQTIDMLKKYAALIALLNRLRAHGQFFMSAIELHTYDGFDGCDFKEELDALLGPEPGEGSKT